MITSLRERILSMIKAKKLNINSLSALIGVPQTSLNLALKGDGKLNSSIVLLLLDYFPDVSAEWLMRGKGEMFIAENSGSSIVINNTKHTGNGDAITGSNVGKAHTIADEHYYRTIIAQKEEQLAAKDKRINELTDHIIQLATSK